MLKFLEAAENSRLGHSPGLPPPRARARGKSEGAVRGGSGQPYPAAVGLGVDGDGVRRGWSDPRGRYSAR